MANEENAVDVLTWNKIKESEAISTHAPILQSEITDPEEFTNDLTGYGYSRTSSADEIGNGAEMGMPLDEAFEIMRFSKNPIYVRMRESQESDADTFESKQGDIKLPRDTRASYADRAIGIRQAIAVGDRMVVDATERIRAMSTDERLGLGGLDAAIYQEVTGRPAIPFVAPEMLPPPKVTAKPTASQVRANTDNAIAFFEKN